MTSWERIEQLLGKKALEHLSRQTVAVVGVGSGGGFVAVESGDERRRGRFVCK